MVQLTVPNHNLVPACKVKTREHRLSSKNCFQIFLIPGHCLWRKRWWQRQSSTATIASSTSSSDGRKPQRRRRNRRCHGRFPVAATATSAQTSSTCQASDWIGTSCSTGWGWSICSWSESGLVNNFCIVVVSLPLKHFIVIRYIVGSRGASQLGGIF